MPDPIIRPFEVVTLAIQLYERRANRNTGSIVEFIPEAIRLLIVAKEQLKK